MRSYSYGFWLRGGLETEKYSEATSKVLAVRELVGNQPTRAWICLRIARPDVKFKQIVTMSSPTLPKLSEVGCAMAVIVTATEFSALLLLDVVHVINLKQGRIQNPLTDGHLRMDSESNLIASFLNEYSYTCIP